MRGEAASADSRLVRVIAAIAVIAFVIVCIVLGNPWILTSEIK